MARNLQYFSREVISMQFLQSIFEDVQSAVSRGSSAMSRAYAGVQEMQAGSSFSDFIREENNEAMQAQLEEGAAYIQNYYNQLNNASMHAMEQLSDVEAMAADILRDFEENAYGMANNGEESSFDNLFMSPYSMHDTANSADGGIRFNQDEVTKLLDDLMGEGYMNQNALHAIGEAGQNINGVSSEEILESAMAALMGENEALTKLEEQQLLSLSQKLAGDAANGESILANLQTLDAEQALDAIANAIEAKGSVTFSSEELGALGSMLQLSDEEQAKLENMLADLDQVSLSKDDFNTLMASARNEMNRKQDELKELTAALGDKLEVLEQEARQRIEFEESTRNYETKQTELTRLTMENTHLTDVLQSFKDNELQQEVLLSQLKLLENSGAIENFKDPTSLASGLSESLRSAVSFAKDSSSTKSNKDQSNSFNQSGQSAQAFEVQQNATTRSETTSYAPTLSKQVEDALLQAMKSEMTKLEVELNPVELGALTVIMTSKNGELTAQIQPEKQETMHVINQQVDAIKRELENQGIKIESIEVDLKSSDNFQFAQSNNENASSSQSQQYENMQQQVAELNRLRVLGRGIEMGVIPEDALSSEELDLARNLLQSDESYTFEENNSYLNLVA